MAPTRELALQIDLEIKKLLSSQMQDKNNYSNSSRTHHSSSKNNQQRETIKTCPIVGGQNMQHQAQELRSGVHIVVGTPGRINECIDMAYLVLNQCCYIVLDEADRMIDMGFAPQMESILDAMGGLLKSENEKEAYQQEQDDLYRTDVAKHRLTAMFSATMPLEVERIAKRYLRHPAIISIGDQDSSKNSRIVQKLVWVASSAKKEDALRILIRDPKFIREKVIVFVNEKRHADHVGRIVERSGRQCVVLHGGKSQEQREESLDIFRKGAIVLVATDVAGRGLVCYNFDMIV
jgi:ATP-dependent RNA helicase DDX23/PRP28